MALTKVKGSVWTSAENSVMINVKDFGAVGDGVTDDTTAIQTALTEASGKTIYFPSGTYVVNVGDSETKFSPGADTLILGDGWQTILRFNLTGSANTRVLWNIDTAKPARFENLKMEIGSSVVGATVICFSTASELSCDFVEINGAVTGDSSVSHLFQVIKCANTGAFGGIRVTRSFWYNVTRVWLRENSSTATVTTLRFLNNAFVASRQSMFALNAPNGSIDRVVFSNNTFVNAFIDAIQADGYFIGPQAKNVVISGNTFLGSGQECIHVEEACEQLSITGNVIDMNCVTQAVSFTENNVGGSTVVPKNVTITGNVIHRNDQDGATGDAIDLINDGGTEPVNNIIIQGNVISGWGTGIRSAIEDRNGCIINNNIISDCGTGFQTTRGLSSFRDNQLRNCTTGIGATGGGSIGFTEFYECTTNVNPVSCEITLLGFEIHFPRTTLPNSSNVEFDLFPTTSTDRFHGYITVHAFFNDLNEDKDRAELTWDGTTFTNTNIYNIGGGQILVSYQNSSNMLKLRVANGGTELADSSVQCRFDGAVVIS